MTNGERRIARKLLIAIFDRGLCVDIHDDPTICNETLAVDRATAKQLTATLRKMNSTGQDAVVVRDSHGAMVGWFHLIYGNAEDGEELIADHSGHALSYDIYKEIHPDD
jgi:hypothetical protein